MNKLLPPNHSRCTGQTALVAAAALDLPATDEELDPVIQLAAEAAAGAFGISAREILGSTKEQPVAFARQVTCYLLHETLCWSCARIERLMGLSPRTASWALHTVDARLSTEKRVRQPIIMATERFLDAWNRELKTRA